MTEPNRQSGENEERIIEIEIERLRPFKEHPFQVKDDSILDRSGYSIARVSKELFHMTDTYVIDVQDPGNALDALMFVLAIDAEKCSRN